LSNLAEITAPPIANENGGSAPGAMPLPDAAAHLFSRFKQNHAWDRDEAWTDFVHAHGTLIQKDLFKDAIAA